MRLPLRQIRDRLSLRQSAALPLLAIAVGLVLLATSATLAGLQEGGEDHRPPLPAIRR